MKITQVSVTYGRKFNLDDYESLHVETTMWAEVEEDEKGSVQALTQELFAEALYAVKERALPVLKVRDEKRRQLSKQVEEAYGAD